MARPVSIITGYLGSGKSTLLNALLQQPAMSDTAVVINEFGEVSIDHMLVETSLENTVVLQSGCICCTIRGDLVDTLCGLEDKRQRGLIPAFSRVLVETTGLADPAPIVHTLATEPVLRSFATLGSVIATVDAVHGLAQLAQSAEPVSQVAVADVVLITKADLAGPETTALVRAQVEHINPTAAVLVVSFGQIDADALWAAGARARPPLDTPAEHRHHDHGSSPSRHAHAIRATSIVKVGSLPWNGLRDWLRSIISLRGADILRIKCVVSLEGHDLPVVIQGVHHLVHPLTQLSSWPDGRRMSSIVVIARGLEGPQLEASLDRFIDAVSPAQTAGAGTAAVTGSLSPPKCLS